MARLYLNPVVKWLAHGVPAVDRGLRGLEMAIVDAVWSATQRRDLERASDMGAAFGAAIGPRLRKHRHILRNLRIAFPERDEAWVRATARGVWRQIGRVLAEYPHIDELCRQGAQARVVLESQVDLELLRHARPGHVLVAMHQANWNLPALAGMLGDFPLDVVYAEQRHPEFEAMIAAHRNRMPCGFIHVDTVPRAMIQALRAGRSVGLFVDHRIDQGDPVPFFGREALTTTIPARVACKLGTGVIPTCIQRLDGVRFRIVLAPPLHADPTIDDPRAAAIELMGRVHRQFEAWIREKPEDWCCVKRRWSKPPHRSLWARLLGLRAAKTEEAA